MDCKHLNENFLALKLELDFHANNPSARLQFQVLAHRDRARRREICHDRLEIT